MAVKTTLTDFLATKGFEREKGDNLTYAYRRRRSRQHDLYEIQFSKYQTPRFKINLGTVPAIGLVDWLGRLVQADEVHIYQLAKRAELCAVSVGKLLLGWFGIGCLSVSASDQAAAAQIRKVERLFSQAEQWFETGRKGPNLRMLHLPEYGPNVLRQRLERNGTWPPDYWTEKDEAAVRRAEALFGTSGSTPSGPGEK